MKMIHTDGIVIREQPIKEQDRLVTILTKDAGLVRAFANGARSPKSKHLAATSLLTYGSFSIGESGGGTFYIRESSIIENFFELREDLLRLSLAQYFAEIAADLAPKEQEAPEMLSLLLNAVHLLTVKDRDERLVKAAFELRFASLSGFMPSLVACESCGKYETDAMKFCPGTGRLFCASCEPREAFTVVPLSVVYAMRHICFSEKGKVFSFRLSNSGTEQLAELSERYLLSVTGHGFKTLNFYKSMTR